MVYVPTSKLSNSFRMYEVAKSSIADRNSIDNTPSSDVLIAASLLAVNVLEPIRSYFQLPISPSSWYRGELLERYINDNSYKQWCSRNGKKYGSITSISWKQYFAKKSHPKGEAVDFEIAGVPNDVIVKWIDAEIPEYDQLIREFPKSGDPHSGWVHVSFSATNNRRERFIIN